MTTLTDIQAWQQSRLGQCFLDCERQAARDCLHAVNGRYAVQVGQWGGDLLDACRVARSWIVDIDDTQSAGLCSSPAQLALSTESLDAVLLTHVLERTSNPHNVLREAHRVLAGEGKLFVFGFNPWSSWGLPGVFGVGNYPWSGRFIGETRLRDWLTLLEFEIIDSRRFFYRPPINNKKFLDRTRFLERIAARWLPIPASAYVLIARKKIAGMTPIPVRFKQTGELINGMAAPTARVFH